MIHALSDDGNAHRFVEQHRDKVRWVLDDDEWRWYRNTHWESATDEQVILLARMTSAAMIDEVKGESDDTRRAKILRWAAQSQSASRLRAMVDVAKSDPRVWARSGDFDTDPFLLNVLNGTVDLRTGEVRTHDPALMQGKLVEHRYVPTAGAPLWEGLVQRATAVSQDDGATAEFMQRLLGYAITGVNMEQIIAVLVGPARVGKSKLIEIIRDVLGPSYAHVSRPDLLVKKKFGHHDSETYSLRGCRYVTISETDAGMDLDEARVKDLVGANKVAIRGLYQRAEQVAAVTWTIIVATNEAPNVEHWDDAIARRMVIVPFGPQLTRAEMNPTLADDILSTEAEGVLAWLIAGAVSWWHGYQRTSNDPATDTTGLAAPESVRRAGLAYATSNDHVSGFIQERCELAPDVKASAADVNRAYKQWRGTFATQVKRGALYKRLLEVPGVTKDERYFYGLALVDDDWRNGAALRLSSGTTP